MEQPWFIAPSLYRPPDPFAFYALALVLTVIYLSSVSMQQTMMMMLNYIEHATAHVTPAFWPLPSRWPCVSHIAVSSYDAYVVSTHDCIS
jgi:hypothetical protein